MYLDHFKLREKPFNVTPDPHFLYMSPSHQEAFANLLYGVRERQGFILVTGEVGTGKTTLLHNLLENLDESFRTVFVFHTGLDFVELLEMIHHELGIPVPATTKAALLQSLNRFLIEQLDAERNVAILIDEAQNLSPEILENLRLLSNLETAKDKLLQIILVGQPELEEKLELPQLRQLQQRISVRSRIDTLSADESKAYVLHRIGVAGGGQGTPIFGDEALALIAEAAKGVPRRLNVLCDNALLIAYAEGDRLVQAKHVREALSDQPKAAKAKARPKPRQVGPIAAAEPAPRRRWPLYLAGFAVLAAAGYGGYQYGRQGEGATSPLTQAGLAVAVAEAESLPAALPDARDRAPASVEAAATSGAEATAAEPRILTPAAASSTPPEASAATTPAEESLHRRFWRASTPAEIRAVLDRCPRRAYTVKRGDIFIRIAFEQTGRQDDDVIAVLQEMNPHISNLDHIEPGWVLYLPDLGPRP